jgi:hypothetical protein
MDPGQSCSGTEDWLFLSAQAIFKVPESLIPEHNELIIVL